SKHDGKCTQGIAPVKSNWAQRLDTPPYYAFPVTCGITFTFGGVEINRHGQVLNTGGRPIRGLFASGDIMGLFFHNYPSCSGQTRNLVFGMIAGQSAAASIHGL
ncbi:MAG: FAD-binding protein, partial [Deltaproteobacteria bacterium]|nr:FAD-binding protein [Deltaproteobacteria bacterium]